MHGRNLHAACVLAAVLSATALSLAQQQTSASAPVVRKLDRNVFAIGEIRVDTGKRELSVPGKINDVMVLEFIANTPGGLKAYESAITLETDAVAFNAALLLLGLDRSRSRAPERHFDPSPPKGDEVAIDVEWTRGAERTRVPVGTLLYDREKNAPIPSTKWVYTGSTFLPDGKYMAEVDGTLIGFVRSPSPIIEEVGGAGVGRYGFMVMNPELGLMPNTPVTVIVKVLGTADKSR